MPCKDDEIVNPKSGRCVKKNGKIGKALLAAATVSPNVPKSPSPTKLVKTTKTTSPHGVPKCAADEHLVCVKKETTTKHDIPQEILEKIAKMIPGEKNAVNFGLGNKQLHEVVKKRSSIEKNLLNAIKEIRELHPKYRKGKNFKGFQYIITLERTTFDIDNPDHYLVVSFDTKERLSSISIWQGEKQIAIYTYNNPIDIAYADTLPTLPVGVKNALLSFLKEADDKKIENLELFTPIKPYHIYKKPTPAQETIQKKYVALLEFVGW